jgi:O-antigen/teichoic acid export membrane protein
LNIFSVGTRFIVSVLNNIFRAGISFATGILVARGLSPDGYGDFAFLLGSFVAIRSLLDMGSSSAFYTFLSQRARDRRFYLFYFVWLALQLFVTLLLIACIMPSEMIEQIWLGHSRGMIILAFLAAFMQQQVWQMIGQIGEAARKTVRIQLLNTAVAITYLAAVWIVMVCGIMSVELMLQVLILQYAGAAFGAYWFLKETNDRPVEIEVTLKQMARDFLVYCRPLIGLYIVNFFYLFAGKWMLQKFGGAAQQGYFQVASQFAQVSLLATGSILQIFWKEIAEATAQGNHERVAHLYQSINRGLVMLSALMTGLFLPWSEQIVAILLGPAYVEAWPVLAVMLLYPIHQSMGQIGGTMFLASCNTRTYVNLSCSLMLVSFPFYYFIMAPISGMFIPGLGLGAIGMACYTVVNNTFAVNVQAWFIARNGGWQFDWIYQAVGIPLMLGLGYLVKAITEILWVLDGIGIADMKIPIIFALFVYAFGAVLIIWSFPWLIGMERKELYDFLKKLLWQKKLLGQDANR